MSQTEDTNHQYSYIATSCLSDHLNHLSTDQLQAELQQLLKAYQCVKQERDMLKKALYAYFAGLAFPKTL